MIHLDTLIDLYISLVFRNLYNSIMKMKSTRFLDKKIYFQISRILIGFASLYSDLRIARSIHPSILLYLIVLSTIALAFQIFAEHVGKYFPAYRQIALFSGLYLAFLTYHISTLIVTDLVGIFLSYDLSRLGLLVSIAITIYERVHAHSIKTVSYTYKTNKLPAAHQYTIVQLSDLHIGEIIDHAYIHHVVCQTNALHPDLIVITGDVFNRTNIRKPKDIDRIFAELAQLQACDGVFAICGNHDPSIDSPLWQDFLKRSNIIDLNNQSFISKEINLIGRTRLVSNPTRIHLKGMMQSCDRSKPIVILDHDPSGIVEAQVQHADLILCGHTHKGQFFPCTFFTRYWYGKDYYHGKHIQNGTCSIVSAGTGYFEIPVRIGTDNEIVKIQLQGIQ